MAELSGLLGEDSLEYVAQMKPLIRKSYGIDFEEFLRTPMNYADNPKIADKAKAMEKDVDAFIDQKIASKGEEKAALDSDLAVIDNDYKKINQLITTKASIAQVPYVRPLFIDIGEKEEIVVEGYDAGMDQLVTRMINISDYIADMSSAYNNYTIGSWLFSGKTKYVISISPPQSDIMAMDRARQEIKALLESIYSKLNTQ